MQIKFTVLLYGVTGPLLLCDNKLATVGNKNGLQPENLALQFASQTCKGVPVWAMDVLRELEAVLPLKPAADLSPWPVSVLQQKNTPHPKNYFPHRSQYTVIL